MAAGEKLEVKYVFGIDLGTTYSEISYLDNNLMIQVCKNHEGSQITPSVVKLDDGGVVVGQVAKDDKVFCPYNVLDGFKRNMDKGEVPINYGENYDKAITPIELSAEVLKYLAKYASEVTESAVKIVTITVPAYFGAEQKAATKKAAELAGFTDVHLIEEPTAAAVYYGYKGDRNETVLVYDLGGGTFDIVAVEINGYQYDCSVIKGDHQLGGKDWDEMMVELITEKLSEQNIDVNQFDESDEADIKIQAEEAKKALTQMDSKDVKFRLSCGRATVKVTREEFEQKTKHLLDQTIETTKQVKAQVEESGKSITKILLIGGSTYMPQVRDRLIAEFSDVEVPPPMDPNLAVSMGAAYYGKKIIDEILKEKEKQHSNDDDNNETGENKGSTYSLPTEVEAAREELKKSAEENKWVIPVDEMIEIKKVSVSSIGLQVRNNETGNNEIMTLLKCGEKLPVSQNIKLPISNQAIDAGVITLGLYEHRSEKDFLTFDDVDADIEEMSKQNGEISTGLPYNSMLDLHLEINEEGLLVLTGTDPNGKTIELKATANAGSALN